MLQIIYSLDEHYNILHKRRCLKDMQPNNKYTLEITFLLSWTETVSQVHAYIIYRFLFTCVTLTTLFTLDRKVKHALV